MVTLIIRLCTICAVSALMELASTGMKLRGGLRLVCGMLMLAVTISQIREIADAMMQQRDLIGIFECIMR